MTDRSSPAGKPAGLTGAQEGVWYAQAVDPENPIFNTGLYLEFAGPIDRRLLSAAIERTVREADGLHVRFEESDDGPVQHPGDPSGWQLPIIDLTDTADPEARAQQWMHRDLGRTPVLDGPLFSSALLCSSDDRLLWYLSAHHIVADGYALSLITQRTAEIYTALIAGTEPAGAGFRPYQELLADEAGYRTSPRYQRDREHWGELFADRPTVRSLTDRIATTDRTFHRCSGSIDARHATLIKNAAARARISWPESVIAAAAIYLRRLTGDPDVVLGVPTMGRLGTSAASIPSMVVNVPPLRLRLHDQQTMAELRTQITQRLGQLRRHQRYRYEQLARDLGIRPGAGRLCGPQINVMPFAYGQRFGDILGEPHHLAAGPVDDLTLCLYSREDGGFHLDLDANPRLYSALETAAHLRRLTTLITAVAEADGGVGVGSLDVLTAEDHDQLDRWNRTAHSVPATTLPELFGRQVRRTPNAIALRHHDRELSYSELYDQAGDLAAELLANGAGPGRIVAVCLPRSIQLVIALYAVQRAGAAYLPVDPDYPADRREFMIDDADPVCVIDDRGVTPVVDHDQPETSRQVGPDDPAYVIYTSGSTGRPKGVVIPHRGVVNRLLWMQDVFGLTENDRVLQKTPSSFDVSVWEFFWPLQVGATLVLADAGGHRDPAYLARLIIDEQISTVHFVPSMLDAFLAEPAAAGCAALRRVICSGEALSAATVRRFHSVLDSELDNLYGPTEASIDVTRWRCDRDRDDDPVPVGRPIWNTRCLVLDDRRRPLPSGAIGELFLGGAGLADGYLGRPELTAERFVDDPTQPGQRLYRTGDLARWRTDGSLEFLGRNDHQVKLRGMRIELGEIESAIGAQPGVERAVVIMREDVPGDQRLVGYLLTDPHTTVDLERLRAQLSEHLPAYMIPTALVNLTELPVTANGKLDHGALPQPDLPSAGRSMPQDYLQEQLTTLIAQVLGVNQVGVEDNFFDLGGQSLTAARLATLIRTRLGHETTLGTILARPTAAQLADQLRGTVAERGDGLQPTLALRPSDTADQPAVFCLYPAGGIGWSYSRLVPHLPLGVGVYAIQATALTDSPQAPLPSSISAMAARAANEIRTVQPEGPYRIIGWSVGGVIAHEVAVQLQEDAEDVALLGLLDAYPGEQWRRLAQPTGEELLLGLLHMAGLDETTVADGTPLDLDTVQQALRSRGSAFAGLDPQTVRQVTRIVANNAQLMRTHRSRQYDGDLLFVTATAPRKETWLTATAWQPYVTGEIKDHGLLATHPGLMIEPAVGEIGRILSGRLDLTDGPRHPRATDAR